MFNRRARLCGRLGLTPLPKLGANGLVGFEVSCRDKRDFRGCGLAGVAPIPEGQSAKPLPNAKFSAHFLLPSARRKSAISLRTTDDDDCPSRARAFTFAIGASQPATGQNIDATASLPATATGSARARSISRPKPYFASFAVRIFMRFPYCSWPVVRNMTEYATVSEICQPEKLPCWCLSDAPLSPASDCRREGPTRPSAPGSAAIPSAPRASPPIWKLAVLLRTPRPWPRMKVRAPPNSMTVPAMRSRSTRWSGSRFDASKTAIDGLATSCRSADNSLASLLHLIPSEIQRAWEISA